MEDSSMMETALLIPTTGIPLVSPDYRRSSQRQLAVYLILTSTVFERLAFYALAMNLVVNLKSAEWKWSASTSTSASFIFLGTTYISSLIFAVISDAKLGRAKTIIIGFILYFIGYLMTVLITNDRTYIAICGNSSTTHTSVFSERCGGPVIGILVFMAIGIGAVQSNMAVFGAEQIFESKLAARYFDKYYIAVNIGATIATLSIPLIQSDPNDESITNNYFYGYLVAFFMLICAFVLFILGHRYYFHISTCDSIIVNYIPVIINAFQTRRQYGKRILIRNRDGEDLETNHSSSNGEGSMITNEESLSFLDYANVVNQGKYTDQIVNDVKSLQRAFVVFLLLIPYWIIYYQMQITFPLQGQQMAIPTLSFDNKMPISWISLGDSITIILGLVILNISLHKYLHTWNRSISIKIKLIIGMAFASLAMLITGIMEIIRQAHCISEMSYSSLSIFYQLPQNICMGLAEIFATIASLEFAYLAAPRSAQTFFMSLQFCSLGISSFIGNGYLAMYSSDSTFDFNCSHYNRWTFFTYFFVLAILQIAFMVIVHLCERRYHILKLNPHQIQAYQFEEN